MMKAVAVNPAQAADAPRLIDIELPAPEPLADDLLVAVKAVAINPIELKMVRARANADGSPRILGWDAAGVVHSVGSAVIGFKPGDAVYYAGSITRPGAQCELHSVDHRLAAHKPESLSFAEASALPLSALTAWEALFERIGIEHKQPAAAGSAGNLLVLGGAGGVASIAIQLAAQLSAMRVIATASRPESRLFCLQMGAADVIDHSQPLGAQMKAIGVRAFDAVLCLTDPAPLLPQLAEIMAPRGHVCALTETSADLPMNLLRAKSISFSWHGVFTRSLYHAADMARQGEILAEVARLIDAGILQSTMRSIAGPIDADHVLRAHRELAGGRMIGKLVLER